MDNEPVLFIAHEIIMSLYRASTTQYSFQTMIIVTCIFSYKMCVPMDFRAYVTHSEKIQHLQTILENDLLRVSIKSARISH